MASRVTNFGDSKIMSFDRLPVGSYAGEITKVEVRQGRASKEEYMVFTIRIETQGFEGKTVRGNVSLSPKAAFAVQAALWAAGLFSQEELEAGTAIRWDEQDFVGQKIGVVVEEVTYMSTRTHKQETSTDVRRFIPAERASGPLKGAEVAAVITSSGPLLDGVAEDDSSLFA